MAQRRRMLHGAVKSENVRRVQEALHDLGLDPGPIDGIYGFQTARAVRAFQKRQGLHTDGVVGRATWSRLAEEEAGKALQGRTLRGALFGATAGEDVRALQLALDKAGLEPGQIDGVYGPNTERAVVAFQRARGLLVDGLVGDETWDRLEALGLLGDPPGHSAGPLYAGFSPDSPVPQDQLGVRDLVDVLCSVLAARNLEPPLALGLFGPWGSGKSFFMRQMQQRISELTARSAEAVASSRATSYCTHILQVNFNAWLYSDSDLWPSLAAEVFRGLAGSGGDQIDGAWGSQEHQPSTVAIKVERERVDAESKDLQAELDRTRRRLEDLSADAGTGVDDLSPEARAVATAAGTVREGISLTRRLVDGWRLMSVQARLLVGTVVVAGVGMTGLAIADAKTAQAVSAAVVSVGAAGAAGGRGLRSINRIVDQEEERRSLRAREADLERELRARADESEKMNQALSAFSADLLPTFAADQVAFWSSRERVGVVTEVRRRFLRLSDFITDSRLTRQAGHPDPAPLDRVIVYVDDLDRCPADVVVRVLEAIKLLMDLPHFVVVVGVDSRWLFASLEQWLFGMASSGSGHPAPGSRWTATPEDYLEKIFQYSVRLPPMTSRGYARLVSSLFSPPLRPESAPEGGRDGEDSVEDAPPSTVAPDEPGTDPASRREAVDDLTPTDLALTAEELEFMSWLGPLIRTPRAAKRLTNVYRLLRVAVGEERLLRAKEYEIVLTLLAAVIGSPRQAAELFRDIDAGDGEAWRRLRERLETTPFSHHAEGLEAPLATVKGWIPVVDSFSFHPWEDASP